MKRLELEKHRAGLQRAARVEAFKRYKGDEDPATGKIVDDWGYSDAERLAFMAGFKHALDLIGGAA